MDLGDMTLKDLPDTRMFGVCQGEQAFRAEESLAPDFDTVFRQFQPSVYRLAFRILGNRDDALELAQEVFLTVYRKLPSFRGESSVKTWLYRITVNKAVNQLRWWRVRRRQNTFSLQGLDPARFQSLHLVIGNPGRNPEQAVIGQEISDNLQRSLNRLRPKHRIVLVMRDLEEMTYDDIARSLHVSIGTVKSRIARAREELRAVMDQWS